MKLDSIGGTRRLERQLQMAGFEDAAELAAALWDSRRLCGAVYRVMVGNLSDPIRLITLQRLLRQLRAMVDESLALLGDRCLVDKAPVCSSSMEATDE